HLILRGGRTPNYDAASVQTACQALRSSDCRDSLMIDLSHANSGKQPQRQLEVAEDVAQRIAAGNANVLGAMVESHLVGGRQAFTPGVDDPATLVYGQSITDGCLGWDESVTILEIFDRAILRKRHRG